jgi:hypothetical protein
MKDDIVDRVVSSSGFVVGVPTHDRLLKYLRANGFDRKIGRAAYQAGIGVSERNPLP